MQLGERYPLIFPCIEIRIRFLRKSLSISMFLMPQFRAFCLTDGWMPQRPSRKQNSLVAPPNIEFIMPSRQPSFPQVVMPSLNYDDKDIIVKWVDECIMRSDQGNSNLFGFLPLNTQMPNSNCRRKQLQFKFNAVLLLMEGIIYNPLYVRTIILPLILFFF